MQIEVKLYGDLKKYAPHDQTNFMLMLDAGGNGGGHTCRVKNSTGCSGAAD